jgi:hypothetical protein
MLKLIKSSKNMRENLSNKFKKNIQNSQSMNNKKIKLSENTLLNKLISYTIKSICLKVINV